MFLLQATGRTFHKHTKGHNTEHKKIRKRKARNWSAAIAKELRKTNVLGLASNGVPRTKPEYRSAAIQDSKIGRNKSKKKLSVGIGRRGSSSQAAKFHSAPPLRKVSQRRSCLLEHVFPLRPVSVHDLSLVGLFLSLQTIAHKMNF
jgi:hypothetical protein